MYPEYHGSASGVVLEYIRKAKMVKKTVGGSVPGIHFEIMYICLLSLATYLHIFGHILFT